MAMRTRITELAHARGLTAAEVARRLGLYPSNISAMDAGRRAVSLQALSRIAQVLDCGPADLLECSWEPAVPPFRERALRDRLHAREDRLVEGTERGWVHRALLAWQRHSRAARPTRRHG